MSPKYFFQKQPFANVLQNRCSEKFRNIHGETPVPESLQLYQKETPTQVFSCENCEIFKNSFFIEHLLWLILNLSCLSNKRLSQNTILIVV